jgi:FlaG/FlaF family flagellin (archaellin)
MKSNSPLRDLVSKENRAVSPVLGVVLVAAIAVVLATTVGAFALGVTDQLAEPAPEVTFEATTETATFHDGGRLHTATTVLITHRNGRGIDPDDLRVTVNGRPAWDAVGFEKTNGETVSPLAGVANVSSGTTFRVVLWENGDGGYPVGDGDLEIYRSGGCGVVFSDVTASNNCALARDELDGGDTVRVIYEGSTFGTTAILYEYTV